MKKAALFIVALTSLTQLSFAAEGEAEFVFTRQVSLNANETLYQRDITTTHYIENYSRNCKVTVSSPAVSSPSFKAGRKVILQQGKNSTFEFSILDPDNRKKLGDVYCSSTGNEGPLTLLKNVLGVQPSPDGLRKVEISYRRGIQEHDRPAPTPSPETQDKFELKDIPDQNQRSEEGLSI